MLFTTLIIMIATLMSFHSVSILLTQGFSVTRFLDFAGGVAIFVCAIFLFKDNRDRL
jgi:hypothetical protein